MGQLLLLEEEHCVEQRQALLTIEYVTASEASKKVIYGYICKFFIDLEIIPGV